MRGSDRFTWIGGRWKKFDSNGNPIGEHIGVERVLKYPEAEDRYIFELLCPAENYGTPTDWELNFTQWIDGQRVETLGPFPRAGEYELVKVIETPTKRAFVPLTESICDALVQVAKLNKELPERIKREAARQHREQQERATQNKIADMIENLEIDQRPHIYVPSDYEKRKYAN